MREVYNQPIVYNQLQWQAMLNAFSKNEPMGGNLNSQNEFSCATINVRSHYRNLDSGSGSAGITTGMAFESICIV